MTTLFCNGCLTEQPEEAFPWRNRLSGVKHRICNACVAAKSRRHYESNPTRYYERVKSRRAETRVALERYTSSQGCVSCGETDPVCLVLVPRDESATAPSALTASARWSSIEPQLSSYHVMCLNDRARAQARVDSSSDGVIE